MSVTLRSPVKLDAIINPINRNNNTNGSIFRDGTGPFVAKRIATGDYRIWGEAYNNVDYPGGVTNTANYWTSTNGETYTLTTTSLIVPSAASPDNGEFCPVSMVWNPEENLWFLYGHVGGNAGPRNTVLYTSTNLTNGGTWTRSQTVLTPTQTYEGFGGPNANQLASDFKATRLSAGSWMAYYRAGNTGALSGIAYATSTNGRAWTKLGTVLVPATGWESNNISLFDYYLDGSGRVHMWYVGDNGTLAGIGYATSDNKTTFTKSGANPVIAGTGTSGVYDKLVVSQCNILDDGDLVFVGFGAMNLDDYAGAGGFPLRGNAFSFTPKEPTSTPAQPGRHFHATASRITWPSGAAFMMPNATWSMYLEFKAPTWRATSGGRGGLHTEWNAFNHLSALSLKRDGKLEFFYRDGTNIVTLTSTGTYDDNVWHRVLIRRISASSWEFYVDSGTAIITSSATATTDANVPIICTGGWAPTATGDEPAYTTIRRVVGISGYAMTWTEANTIWNSGAGNGALPASGTKKIDAKPGSGGSAGPDIETAQSLSGTVASGAVMVDAAIPAAVNVGAARHFYTPPALSGIGGSGSFTRTD